MIKRLTIVSLLCTIACGSHADHAAPTPAAPAKPTLAIPDGISISVEIDGAPAPPIDSAALRAHPPRDATATALTWRLGELLGGHAARKDEVLDVASKNGVRAVITRPAQSGADEPLLVLHAPATVDFIAGNQHLAAPASIRIYLVGHDPALAATLAPKAADLAITIDGKPAPPWTADGLAEAPALSLPGAKGPNDVHDAWSLHDLAGAYRVESLTGEDGEVVHIDPKDWNDAGRIPVIRLNRKGLYKFEWVSATHTRIDTQDLRSVTAISLRSK